MGNFHVRGREFFFQHKKNRKFSLWHREILCCIKYARRFSCEEKGNFLFFQEMQEIFLVTQKNFEFHQNVFSAVLELNRNINWSGQEKNSLHMLLWSCITTSHEGKIYWFFCRVYMWRKSLKGLSHEILTGHMGYHSKALDPLMMC